MIGGLSADLTGKTVLVTGASSGLGRHFAGVLARTGARVVCAARSADKLAELVSSLSKDGGAAEALSMDVTDEDSINAAVSECGQIDVLVNNAGVAQTKRVLDVEPEDWDFVMDTNLKGAWMVARAAARRMVEQETGGAIINIASILGERVSGGVMPYAVSKAGLVQLTKVLALELAGRGVRVNALAPGYIKTDINRNFLESEAGEKLIKRIPQRRYGIPQDLDGALLLLASDASNFMTGAVIAVDGGHLVNSL